MSKIGCANIRHGNKSLKSLRSQSAAERNERANVQSRNEFNGRKSSDLPVVLQTSQPRISQISVVSNKNRLFLPVIDSSATVTLLTQNGQIWWGWSPDLTLNIYIFSMVVYILVMYTQVQCTFTFTYSTGLLIVDYFKYYVALSRMCDFCFEIIEQFQQ